MHGSHILIAVEVCTELHGAFLQVHDRDALPQPQFVAPVIEVKAEVETVPKTGKGGKSPVKAPAAKAKPPSVAAVKGQPPVQAEGTSQPSVPPEPATEYVS